MFNTNNVQKNTFTMTGIYITFRLADLKIVCEANNITILQLKYLYTQYFKSFYGSLN